MAEIRLTQQKESLIAEHRGQNLLLTNLQSIQVCSVVLHYFFLSILLKNVSQPW